MHVYRVVYALDSCAHLVCVDPDDEARLEDLDGTPTAKQWRPVQVSWDTFGGTRPPCDATEVAGVPILSDRAVNSLNGLLTGRVELLLLALEGNKMGYALNLTRFSDALDEERSEVDRFEDGRIMVIDRAVFRSDRLVGETIFRLSGDRKGDVYVTDRFVRAVEEAGISGFMFELVWNDAPKPASEEASRRNAELQLQNEGHHIYTRLVPSEEDVGDSDEPIAHRIIPTFVAANKDLERTQARALDLGINPDEPVNAVWLPRGAHHETYSERYFAELWNRLSQATSYDEAVAILSTVASELESGRFPS